jgi:NAD-dependent dihydropyrimidine dehydrogenase PreA subunit
MATRKIIEIERGLCNGCGLCTTACAEGALQLDAENKAILVRELYCDGLGACLDVCPTGALKIVERESPDYDAKAAYRHVLATRGEDAAGRVHGIGEPDDRPHHDHHHAQDGHHGHGHPHGQGHGLSAPGKREPAMACGCPGSLAREIKRDEAGADKPVSGRSELSQWPVQLHLVSPLAPYLRNADLLVAADCTAFALGSFHQDLLKGKKLVIACPKLDDTEGYVEKLAEIIKINELKSLTVAIMTVPCCSGLHLMVREAVERSGASLPLEKVVVGIDGRIAATPGS